MSERLDRQRRQTLRGVAAGAGLLLTALAAPAAAGMVLTPRQSRGPFYPETIPLEHDNDLTRVAGHSQVARGQISEVAGRVLDGSGNPIVGAQVEIWQCDAGGRYHHPRDRGGPERDPGFQGYGTTDTGNDGGYRFRTIKPVSYPGRAPHIHFALQGPGFEGLVTQMYVQGEPQNEHDFLLNRIRDPAARRALIVHLQPAPDGVLHGRFDIVVAGDGRLARLD